MRKISIVGEDGQLHEIDAGISNYSELTDAPIKTTYNSVSLVGSTVKFENGKLVIESTPGHRWSVADSDTQDSELLTFCKHAESGRYDILTADIGTEILMIDRTSAELGDRYRRITVDQDMVYDSKSKSWISISDTTATELVFKIQNLGDLPPKVVVGNSVILKCYYYSTQGNGFLKITKGEKLVAAYNMEPGKTIDVNLSMDITDGVNNFTFDVTNPTGKRVVETIGINAVEITYVPSFKELAVRTGKVNFPFTYSGDGDKYLAFIITNAEGVTRELLVPTPYVGASNSSYAIPEEYFSHGENTVETYMYMKDSIGEILTRTDSTIYHFPYIVSADPVVMTYYDYDELREWDTVAIPYRIWSIDSVARGVSSIKFELTYTQEGGTPIVVTQEYDESVESDITNYLTYNEEHRWQLTNVPHGNLDFRIYVNGSAEANFEKLNVQVAKSEYNFETLPGYMFNLAANDVPNNVPKETWDSEGYSMKLSGFNWRSDGFVQGDNEDRHLAFSPTARGRMVDINPIFNLAVESGFTLEFDFKVDGTAINDEPVIIYHNKDKKSNKGIFIYPTEAVINYNNNSIEDKQIVINYQKGERKNITIVMQPKTSQKAPYLYVYLDGILSKVIHYSDAADFAVCNEFIFNASGNLFDLYAVRAYSGALFSSQITQNYVSNFSSAETKAKMLVQNNIYDEKRNLQYNDPDTKDVAELLGEKYVSFNKVKQAGLIGSMVIIMDSLPVEKKPYKKCRTMYFEKDPAHPEVEWDEANHRSMATTYYWIDDPTPEDPDHKVLNKEIKIGAQGTSSLRYPRKNFKFKFNDKFYIKNHTTGKDKTFTFKIDYMDSSGANNITNAQIMQNGLIKEDWPGTPVQNGARLNLDGFPVLLFWANYVEDGIPYMRVQVGLDEKGDPIYKLLEPEYQGIANFNYDKKAKKLLGWDESTFQGFEFRSNTGTVCLERGIPNMINFEHGSMGFEWRWTYISDIADDFYDGKLDKTMNGGYFDEDGNEYTEAEYLETREDTEAIPLQPYNSFYVNKNGGNYRILKKDSEFPDDMSKASPVNYSMFDMHPALNIFGLEYGVRISSKDQFIYQLPYGVTYKDGKVQHPGDLYLRYIPNDLTEDPYVLDDQGAYRALEDLPVGEGGMVDISGNVNDPFGTGQGQDKPPHYVDPAEIQKYERYAEGYYKYSRNPEHVMKFEYNDTEEYFKNESNWHALCPISELVGERIEFVLNPSAETPYILDKDGRHHLLSNYVPREEDGFINNGDWVDPATLDKYEKQVTYAPIEKTDKILTFDFMREIYKYWYYAVDTLSHCNTKNYRDLIDSNRTYKDELGDNGNGLFIYSALLDYYCLSLYTGLCDNFAKNTFVHSYDGGKTWSHAWYDMDTCFGLNNSGSYVFNYDIDFMDPITFNGSNSTLWKYFYKTCMDDIKSKYYQMRELGDNDQVKNGISYKRVMDVVYNQNIAYKTEAMYNSSAMWRYIVPDLEGHAGTELPAAQGNRLSLLKYWNANRQTFLDSKYGSKAYTGNTITLRMQADRDINWHFVPDTNMILGFSLDDSQGLPTYRSGKVLANTPWDYTFKVNEPLQDKNTYIYGASHLLDVGDLSQTVSTIINLSNATNLKRILIGTDDPKILARQEILAGQKMNLTLPTQVCKNLENIDLHNCKYLRVGGLLDLNLQGIAPSLKRLDVRGTPINDVKIASFCPLEYLGYSDYMTVIDLSNLLLLNKVDFGKTTYVTKVMLKNTPMLDQLQVISQFVNKPLEKLEVDNLHCDKQHSISTDFMEWLVHVDASITNGDIYVQNIADENLNKYREKWPNLTIHLDQIYEDDVIFGAAGYDLAATALTRTLGATNKVAEIGFLRNNVAVRNDFDVDSLPFSDMEVVYDYAADGETVINKWIRIPKFYSYFDGKDTRVSKYKIGDDWVLNPKFLAPDGTERSYIDVSAYPCSIDTSGKLVSKSGTIATRDTYVTYMREAVNKYNTVTSSYDYGLMDYWTYMMIQDLFSVEFATKNSEGLLTGYQGSYIPEKLVNGSLDSLIASTGGESDYAESKKHGSITYRGLENAYGIAQFTDGILIKDGQIFYSADHAKIAKEGDAAITATADIVLPNYGWIQAYQFDRASGIRYPSKTGKSEQEYYVDSFAIDKSGERRVYMGAKGIYSTYADVSASSKNTNGFFRMIRTPKAN